METFRSVAFAHVARHGSSSDGQGDEQGCMHKRTQPSELSTRVFDAGFFVTGEAQAERGKECTYRYMTDRAKTATKPGTKKTS